MDELGALLRRLREQVGITLEQLAELSGVDVHTITGLESGRHDNPSAGPVRQLADALLATAGEHQEAVALSRRLHGIANQASGPVHGQLVQAAVIQGGVMVIGRSRSDPLVEAVDLLAKEVAISGRGEAEFQRINDRLSLPVRWEHAPSEMVDYWHNICGVRAGAGCDPLDLTGEPDEIMRVYRRIPSGRLVVLGSRARARRSWPCGSCWTWCGPASPATQRRYWSASAPGIPSRRCGSGSSANSCATTRPWAPSAKTGPCSPLTSSSRVWCCRCSTGSTRSQAACTALP
ncbi:helix-turn-helix transcriptional regulator [Umezawaea sp. Da 62-37]|uniref:helix-turn-helix domain-containing protein n=1 Tax=Umezawaea sp. Da 62-37 TaxID=3075927 RepID=UPI0028F72CBB|nr:helix-turn-helix transcriptional regulator [Umezawaea sp. Da 62-37]WNV90387.1 helix-turn-helix transcriptional regulator [Umezawaea sp. Da 62-37]